MNVKHRLPCVGVAVEKRAVTVLGMSELAGEQRRASHHLPDDAVIGIGQVIECGDMGSWYHEDMGGSLRVDVVECDDPVVLEHDRGRDASFRDLAEEAVVRHRYQAPGEGWSLSAVR